jgi:hypothetical protein
VISQRYSYDVGQKKDVKEERGMDWIPGRVFRFYRDGFRSMTLGKTLWKIILVKLFIMFAVLKVFFFPDFLSTQFDTDKQRADHVMEQITLPAPNQN